MPYVQPLALPQPIVPPGYVAFIDEAGDDGLRLIRTESAPGASEWFILSAVLVRIERETETVTWAAQLLDALKQPQLAHLHFRTLRDDRKTLVCDRLANPPLRIFTVLSHKRNMQGYINNNAAAAKVNRTAWFYCWCTRMLLERITDYCARRTIRDFGMHRPVRFEFSSRGGVRLDEVRDYFSYLRDQNAMGMMFNKWGNLAWSVVDVRLMVEYPNKSRAGLQLADCVAGAFYQATELTAEGRVNPEFAKALAPRVTSNARGERFGYGVKMIPEAALRRLRAPQIEVFDFYRGYCRKGGGPPDPTTIGGA
ncbi:DUF3800 domain-containing protein [Roseomonas sp. NAR14]|uniref:DUF3800 domain-containing protein n=1 Tax=Roseomonas acroporae TaxID=2937791 RepID=A0A9X1YE73_9PROT|nr:DUF3800 domain-containing protein [Roseomonas acroporae]MCK8788095.1 DUF3800 domain-containing protein [Roseomonas acroporae]